MKLLFLLMVIMPISASFLRFIFLDILNDLVATKTKIKKSRVEVVNNETYVYKQAQ